MSTVAVIAVCLLGIVVSSCSGAVEPPPPNVTLVEDAEKKMENLGGRPDKKGKKKKKKKKKKDGAGQQGPVIIPLEAANEACRKESRDKGIASLAAIFRRTATQKAYAECMERRGYSVEQ